MEVLSTLGIDWKILIAQVINFLIVLIILRAFVYRPLLRVIDNRREDVKRAMSHADEVAREKSRMQKEYADILKRADEEAGAILSKAKTDAETMRAEIILVAQKEATQILQKGQRQLAEERTRVFEELQGSVAESIVTLTERIIRREFSPEDQSRILAHLKESLPALLKS